MSKILNSYSSSLYCEHCEKVTEHTVEKIDENNDGEQISFRGKCNICNNNKKIEQ